MTKYPMMIRTIAIVASMVLLAAASSANADEDATVPGFGHGTVVLAFKGTGDLSFGPVPDPDNVLGDNPDPALCFTVDLVDVRRGRVVGEATDCFVVLGADENGGLQVFGTSTFDFGGGHAFTSQAFVSVQPTTVETPGRTHITGAVPLPWENTVIEGTGRYEGFQASVRLAGAVDLSKLMSEGKVTFDCLFAIGPL